MLGYSCNHCGEFISQTKPGGRRDCPTCRCPAAYTVPFDRGMLTLMRALAEHDANEKRDLTLFKVAEPSQTSIDWKRGGKQDGR